MTAEVRLRADAQRNRELMLAAAERVFESRGAGASLEEVAKEAGVGIGTLYRRFPTRDDLFAAMFSDRFLAFADSWRERSKTLPSDRALRSYLIELVTETNVYRDLAASVGTVLQSETPGCKANASVGKLLLANAQAGGLVQEGVNFDDLVVVVMAVCLSVEHQEDSKPHVERLIDLFLGGIMKARRR